jgi:hypothetical protein
MFNMTSPCVGNIGYVGTIGLQAVVKAPERLYDASRKLRDGNGIKFKRDSASGTHSRCLSRYAPPLGKPRTYGQKDQRRVSGTARVRSTCGGGSISRTARVAAAIVTKADSDGVTIGDDREERFILVRRRGKRTAGTPRLWS